MPNWCNNNLEITHDDPKKIDLLEDAWKANKFFGTIYPEPDYTKVKVKPTFDTSEITGKPNPEYVEPESAWWDWRVQNWGTKWEVASDDGQIQRSPRSLRLGFDTAWSPPIGVYEKLVELGYGVDAFYFESGCGFCGRYRDGSEEYYDVAGDWKWVQENIPESIDLEFAISEQMKEYRAEELVQEIEELEETLKEGEDAKLSAELVAKKQELEEIDNGI